MGGGGGALRSKHSFENGPEDEAKRQGCGHVASHATKGNKHACPQVQFRPREKSIKPSRPRIRHHCVSRLSHFDLRKKSKACKQNLHKPVRPISKCGGISGLRGTRRALACLARLAMVPAGPTALASPRSRMGHILRTVVQISAASPNPRRLNGNCTPHG